MNIARTAYLNLFEFLELGYFIKQLLFTVHYDLSNYLTYGGHYIKKI